MNSICLRDRWDPAGTFLVAFIIMPAALAVMGILILPGLYSRTYLRWILPERLGRANHDNR